MLDVDFAQFSRHDPTITHCTYLHPPVHVWLVYRDVVVWCKLVYGAAYSCKVLPVLWLSFVYTHTQELWLWELEHTAIQ